MKTYEVVALLSEQLDALLSKIELTDVELDDRFYEHMEASLLAASNLVLYWKTMLQANDGDEKQIDALQDISDVTCRLSRDAAMDEKGYILELTEEQLSDYKAHLSHPANIQDIPKPTKSEFGEDNNHPTIKPLKLMEWLVKLLSNEGDTVLDPFRELLQKSPI